MINTDFRPGVFPAATGNNEGIVSSQNPSEGPFEQFYADRERVREVQSLGQGIIRAARNHQGFINSLGRFRGENSSENKKLKQILDRNPLHLTPKDSMDLAIQHISLEAAEVMFLINKGFIQINKPVPKNIQEDLVRLNLAVVDLTKRLCRNHEITITADMIKSFRDIEGFCLESYPCQHGSFEVELKDGRKVSAHLGANDIYSVLKALKDIGISHKDWSHFSGYSTLGEMGWQIRPANEILTQIFEKSAK